MRYDICRALTKEIEGYEDIGAPRRALREMLPVTLEKRVNKISSNFVYFIPPQSISEEEINSNHVELFAKQPSNDRENEIITLRSRFEKESETYIATETTGFRKNKLNFYYSCVEILRGRNIVLVNGVTATYQKLDTSEPWELTLANIVSYVYEYKTLKKIKSPHLSSITELGVFESANIAGELIELQEQITDKTYIRPDYFIIAGIKSEYGDNYYSSQRLPIILNHDGEIEDTKSTIWIPNQCIVNNKETFQGLVQEVNKYSIASSEFEDIYQWDSMGVTYNVFDCDKFLSNKMETLITNQDSIPTDEHPKEKMKV